MLDLLSPYVITTTRACAYTHTHTRTYVLACFFSGKKTQRANLWGRGNSTRANSYCCEGKTIERWKYIDEIESERQKSCQYCSFSSRRLCIKNYIVSYLPKLIKKKYLLISPLFSWTKPIHLNGKFCELIRDFLKCFLAAQNEGSHFCPSISSFCGNVAVFVCVCERERVSSKNDANQQKITYILDFVI